MMGISVWQLLIILAIVLVLFGAKRLRGVGSDLGGAIKGFKHAVKEGGDEKSAEKLSSEKSSMHDDVIEGEVTSREKDKV